MDLASLERQIANKKMPSAVLIFSGPEDFLKERTFEKIVEKLISPEDCHENIFRIDCSQGFKEELINSFSFNSSPRIFLFHNYDKTNAAQRKKLIASINTGVLPDNTYLIFKTCELRHAQELSKGLKTPKEKIDFWRPFENQMATWVKKEATELGGNISHEAAEMLVELTGSSLGILFQELKKLVIALKDKTIGIKDVKANVKYLRQDSVFDFLGFFARRKTREALRSLETLANSGEAPQKTWYLLCKQLRDFRLIHELYKDRPDIFNQIFTNLERYAAISSKTDFKSNQAKKSIIAEIQQISRDMPLFLNKILGLTNPAKIKSLANATNFSRNELTKAWPLLIKTDLKLKSGVPDAKTSIQVFTCEFLANAENLSRRTP